MFVIFFVIPFVGFVLLKGGVYTAFLCNKILIASLFVLFAVFTIYIIRKNKRIVLPSLMLPLLFITVVYLISVIPLPAVIVKYLSPLSFFFNSVSGNHFFRLTLSVPDTVYTVFRMIAFFMFMTIVSRIIEDDEAEYGKRIFFAVALTGAVNVFISIPFYIDRETYYFLRDFIPFVNPNHFGGFSGAAAFASLVFLSLIKKEASSEKLLYIGISLFIINASGLLLSLSRGAIIAFIFSMIFILVFRLIRKKNSPVVKGMRLPAILTTFLFLFAVFLYTQDLVENEFVVSDLNPTGKIEKVSGIYEYFRDFILTGSGAGSFRHVHSFYSSNPEKQFLQLENEPLQLILEAGLIPAVIFFLSLLFIIVKKEKKQLQSKELYYGALFFIFIHNFVDFNLHNFSNLAVAGIFFVSVTDSLIIRHRSGRKAYAVPFAVILILIAFITVPFSYDFNSNIRNESQVMRNLYPSSYIIPMRSAVDLINNGKKDSLIRAFPLLSETMAKAPDYIFPEILTGIALLRTGSTESAVTYFSKALSDEDDNYHNSFSIIYNELKNTGKLKLFADMAERIKITDRFINSLLSVEISAEDLYKISEKKKKEFYVPFCKAALMLNKVDECQKALFLALNSDSEKTIKEKGEIEIIKSQIADKKGEREKALDYGKTGSVKTGNFFHYLYLYHLYAKYGMYTELSSVESELRKMAVNNRKLYSYLLKAKSDVLFSENRIAASIELLEEAIMINPVSQWKYAFAERYYLSGEMLSASLIIDKIGKVNDKNLDIKIKELRNKLSLKKKNAENELFKDIIENKNE